jgi:hypothetical protein
MPWCTGASASMGIMWKNNLYQGRTIDYTCIYTMRGLVTLFIEPPSYTEITGITGVNSGFIDQLLISPSAPSDIRKKW